VPAGDLASGQDEIAVVAPADDDLVEAEREVLEEHVIGEEDQGRAFAVHEKV
jgi:hypothetical protein